MAKTVPWYGKASQQRIGPYIVISKRKLPNHAQQTSSSESSFKPQRIRDELFTPAMCSLQREAVGFGAVGVLLLVFSAFENQAVAGRIPLHGLERVGVAQCGR